MAVAGLGKFTGFDILTTSYKSVNKQSIDVDVFIPRDLSAGIHPLAVQFHGGGLFTGSRNFEEWFPTWLLQHTVAKSAIVIAPDHRLMPENTGLDILEDLDDFWAWTRDSLPELLSRYKQPLEISIQNILVVGQSAGGYLAAQAAIARPLPGIKAAVMAYPMLDVKCPLYTRCEEKNLLGVPMLPPETLSSHIASMVPGQIVTSVDPPDRASLLMVAVQQGRYVELLGSDPTLFPLEQLETAKKLPAMFIYHGTEDSVVPIEGSRTFVSEVERLHPGTKIALVTQPGDHIFDTELTVETPWFKKELNWITTEWLGENAG
ncbi:MAG: hypothetical protein M1819_004066 [Sarea resinae]|nr:MAG: hypothetical protein M1819_004066 [Sarea resinae]